MTKRTIKTALGTYVGKRGGEPFVGAYGWRGDEVDVHEDYLEEFDALNVETGTGEPYEAERVGVEVISPSTAADEDEDDDEKSSSRSAAKKAPAKKA